jgi:cell wall-associated NlpC family hydrolase
MLQTEKIRELRQRVAGLATSWVELMHYVYKEEEVDIPRTVNCYLFTHWIFNECGIILPRDLRGQSWYGQGVSSRASWALADLIFTKGSQGQEVADGVGHVGIIGNGVVIHASCKRRHVVAEPIGPFLTDYELVRVRRMINY